LTVATTIHHDQAELVSEGTLRAEGVNAPAPRAMDQKHGFAAAIDFGMKISHAPILPGNVAAVSRS
jgi:hypothetical protein